VRALGRLGPAAVPLLLLTGCAAEPVTKQAKQINSLYYTTTVIAIVIWLGVTGAILYSIVRYRRRPGDDVLPPQTHGNTTVEVIWTVIPIIIVLVLFAMSYSTLRSVDTVSADEKTAAVIHVRGYQWFWEFDYGSDEQGERVITGSNGETPVLVVPTGETVRVVMTSDNVLHSWFVPNFLFKKDVLVGKANVFEFQVDVPDTYKGQCAELCGTDHSKMTFEVTAVTRAEFDEFLANFPRQGCTGDEQPSTTLEIASPSGTIAFDKPCLVAAANQPVTITYRHEGGTGAPHNVAIRAGQGPGDDVRFGLPQATTIGDGQSTDYKVPALPAGGYTFFCQVHPGMKGEYLVKEAP
jgi:cytochrome c oxidase subunit 2